MKNTDKITLTVRQLKRLIHESIEMNDEDGYIWRINKVEGPRFNFDFIEDSDEIYYSLKDAYEAGIKKLKELPNVGRFEMLVLDSDSYHKKYNLDSILKAVKFNGKIKTTRDQGLDMGWWDWSTDNYIHDLDNYSFDGK